MAVNIPYLSEQHILKLLLSKTRPANLYLHLYSNDPDVTDPDLQITDLREANKDQFDNTFPNGYLPVLLDPTTCNISTDINGKTIAEYDPITFNFANDNIPVIYGYWIENSGEPGFDYAGSPAIEVPVSPLIVERFENPFTINTLGANITITVKLSLSSLV